MTEAVQVTLPENAGIQQAVAVKSLLVDAATAGRPVRIAAAAVRQADTATLQLLLASAANAALAGVAWTLHDASLELRDVAAHLGLTSRLGLGEESP
jgi:ABC-type transporter Mla MlaB component